MRGQLELSEQTKILRWELSFSETSPNYTLEWFAEAGSAPIRSAVKFYFGIDVRVFFFFNFSSKTVWKKIWKIWKSWEKSWKSWDFFLKKKLKKLEKKVENRNFSKFKIGFWKISFFENLTFSKKISIFFWSIEKIFFWRRWKKIRTSISK